MMENREKPIGATDRKIPSVRICPQCGSAAHPQERYCACCGTGFSVVEARRCSSCRGEIHHEVANYCPHCGQRTGDGSSRNDETERPEGASTGGYGRSVTGVR